MCFPRASSLASQAFRTTPITPLRFIPGRATHVSFHRRHRDTETFTELMDWGGHARQYQHEAPASARPEAVAHRDMLAFKGRYANRPCPVA